MVAKGIQARRVRNQGLLWYTAERAVDTAIKESGLSGLLRPSLPEVDMLRTFFQRMRTSEEEALAEAAQAEMTTLVTGRSRDRKRR